MKFIFECAIYDTLKLLDHLIRAPHSFLFKFCYIVSCVIAGGIILSINMDTKGINQAVIIVLSLFVASDLVNLILNLILLPLQYKIHSNQNILSYIWTNGKIYYLFFGLMIIADVGSVIYGLYIYTNGYDIYFGKSRTNVVYLLLIIAKLLRFAFYLSVVPFMFSVYYYFNKKILQNLDLKEFAYSNEMQLIGDNLCIICLKEYELNCSIKQISKCNHHMHSKCLNQWLYINKSCPICRENFGFQIV